MPPDRARLERAIREALDTLLEIDPSCRPDLERLQADLPDLSAEQVAERLAEIVKRAGAAGRKSRFVVN